MEIIDKTIDTVQVIKRGERVYEGTVSRSMKGIRIYAKVHPLVEDLMRSWGTGSADGVSAYGRYWSSPDSAIHLSVYNMGVPQAIDYKAGDSTFSLARPGHPLVDDRGVLNLSFLRLVGISSGVKFESRGVYSPLELDAIRRRIGLGVRQLYIDYLLPVDLNIVISTEDIRR